MTINAILLKCYFMSMFPLLLLVLPGKKKKKDEPQSRATPFCYSFLLLFFEVRLCLRASRLWDCVSCSLIYVRKYSKQHSGTLSASFVTLVWELFCELVKRKKKTTKQTNLKKKIEIFISTWKVPGGATSPKYQALWELLLFLFLFFFL